ncbi:hypothetical protein KX816_15665 [Sphingosinicellaceae bacterium]|nr:hypothetical protein KX816_15665 [Sphingosinicellaceae bacterium]
MTVAAVTYGSVLELPKPAIEALLVDDHDFSDALERSVQRGLTLLDRDAAARTCDPLDDHRTMLAHIRRFLRYPLRK